MFNHMSHETHITYHLQCSEELTMQDMFMTLLMGNIHFGSGIGGIVARHRAEFDFAAK